MNQITGHIGRRTVLIIVKELGPVLRNGFKTLDHAEGQGAVQRKSAAYTVVCEHFEEERNTDIRC
jgi:hypothetical protein